MQCTKQEDDGNGDLGTCLSTGEGFISSDNILGYWTFDETSGITLSDKSGNNNNGTITYLTPQWSTAGKRNGCLDFSNYNDSSHILINYSEELQIDSGAFSISFWMNSSQAKVNSSLIIHKGTHTNLPDDEFNNGRWFGIEIKNTGYAPVLCAMTTL